MRCPYTHLRLICEILSFWGLAVYRTRFSIGSIRNGASQQFVPGDKDYSVVNGGSYSHGKEYKLADEVIG